MPRVTKSDIYNEQDRINKVLIANGYMVRVHVQWAYGKPRAYLYGIDNDSIYKELSPRLPTGQLLTWLDAYHAGLALGLLNDSAEL